MAFSEYPMRRNALIGPWGVGAIVPFSDDESLMIAGLDEWRYNDPDSFRIKDDRLTSRLGVSELRWPPDYRDPSADQVNCNLTIPAVRFPTWYYCPFCGQMKKATYYSARPTCDAIQWKAGRKCDPKKKPSKMIPERFVVLCPEGHIDDFPVAEWVHYGSGHEYNPATCTIRRSTMGSSADLSNVMYQCTCGAKRTLAGATNMGALKKIEYKCKGSKPWLGISEGEECKCDPDDLKVALRGDTNVWFADNISSISIPLNEENTRRKIVGIVNEYFDTVTAQRTNGEIDKNIINFLAASGHVDENELYQAFIDRETKKELTENIGENITDDEYRLQEYKFLCKSSGSDAQDFHSINYPIDVYDSSLNKYFDSISLVPKLRETRAFVGFSRVEPSQKKISESKKELRLGKDEDWLPAIAVYGEGIFFKFNKTTLSKWAQRKDVSERINKLNRAYHNSRFGGPSEKDLRPEFVLIHTFAHLIINQLSYDCGYGSSSIQERIYCGKDDDSLDMQGLLIYTASGDSEGSLGGLVRQGEKGRLENTIFNAINNAEWCSSDPVCIQSTGQGPESLNLAACYNCALLPETCCENGNRLLDRGVVVGTLNDPEMGFFKDLCASNK